MVEGSTVLSLIEGELKRIPDKLQPFLARGEPYDGDVQSWGYFAHAYSVAFERLALDVLSHPRHLTYLKIPLLSLARHSVELHLKWALDECGQGDVPPSHDLGRLLSELFASMALVGILSDGSWEDYCTTLIAHMRSWDSAGERFRYPANRGGAAFDPTRVDLEGLVRAHWHLTSLGDAVCTMLNELRS